MHIVAGLHTGRPVITAFISRANQMGFRQEAIYEVKAGMEAGQREWAEERAGEGMGARRGWLVVAVLVRA